MKNILTICLLFTLLPFAQLKAQTVILEEKIDITGKGFLHSDNFGANQKWYLHTFVQFGGLAFSETKIENPIGSYYWQCGYRAKMKLASVSSLLADLRYSSDYGSIGNSPADPYKYSRYRFQYLTLGLAHRFNFDPKRGNSIGNFLDIGAFGSWVIGNFHKSMNVDMLGVRTLTKRTGFELNTPFAYGVEVRLGRDRFALTAQARLSDLHTVKSVNLWPPLSFAFLEVISPIPYRIGIEVRL